MYDEMLNAVAIGIIFGQYTSQGTTTFAIIGNHNVRYSMTKMFAINKTMATFKLNLNKTIVTTQKFSFL